MKKVLASKYSHPNVAINFCKDDFHKDGEKSLVTFRSNQIGYSITLVYVPDSLQPTVRVVTEQPYFGSDVLRHMQEVVGLAESFATEILAR